MNFIQLPLITPNLGWKCDKSYMVASEYMVYNEIAVAAVSGWGQKMLLFLRFFHCSVSFNFANYTSFYSATFITKIKTLIIKY